MKILKDELLKELKERIEGNPSKRYIRFPEMMDFNSEDGILTITMSAKGLIQNMQYNEAAFEGWAISIKAHLPQRAEKIQVCWRGSDVANNASNAQIAHYTRFLYRLLQFKQSYEWVSYVCFDVKAECDINKVRNELTSKKWIANFPINEASPTEKGEAGWERKIDKILSLSHKANDHQLPVGLFYEKVKKDKEGHRQYERTPRGHSQLDLWSINNKKELYVYELKLDNNHNIGIISELMFYVNVFQDFADGILHYPEDAKASKYRSFDKIYQAFADPTKKYITKIVGVFLSNKLHTLIDFRRDVLFAILDNNSRGISYKQMKYDDTKIYEI
jgi:hypothetical protein